MRFYAADDLDFGLDLCEPGGIPSGQDDMPSAAGQGECKTTTQPATSTRNQGSVFFMFNM